MRGGTRDPQGQVGPQEPLAGGVEGSDTDVNAAKALTGVATVVSAVRAAGSPRRVDVESDSGSTVAVR